MPAITTQPATPARWDDVQHALTGGGDGRSCQCAWLTLTSAEFNTTNADERRALLHDEVHASPPPGLIAYVDGEAAGWVRVGPRVTQRRLARTRTIAAGTHEPLDDESVWAITCFVVRKEHRGLGLNAELLRSAVTLAQGAGARMIEAYPIDTSQGQVRSNDLFHGALSTFLAAGFAPVAEPKPGRPIVTLEL